MSIIDIRGIKEEEKVHTIVFADEPYIFNRSLKPSAVHLYLDSEQKVIIQSDRLAHMSIRTEEDAKNLIKAINHAIELGWWDEQ